ncbi:MAG: SDR family oxidoreductase [Immundisolibacterales bacterium]|nr:SDR family oxidoreductase [Immundisolibacterales bacterium]
MRLTGKNAIVTGAGAGIGHATALRLAEEGARVMVADQDEESGRKTAEEIRRAGGEASSCRTDVSDAAAVERMVAQAVADFGSVNVLVNNAAAFVFGRVEEVSAADWAKVLGVNILGYTHTVRGVLPHMREIGGGAIVNVASQSGFVAQPGFVPYNTSKGGVMQLTRCLAMDLAADNIRVNGVCPGPIYTQASERHMDFIGIDREEGRRIFGQETLLKRMGEPVEIANGILFLASDEASFITGAHLVIDGGATID